MTTPWPTPEEIRDRNFAKLPPEEKLRWLQEAKRFVRENLGAASRSLVTGDAHEGPAARDSTAK